jgi:hypothetical protein
MKQEQLLKEIIDQLKDLKTIALFNLFLTLYASQPKPKHKKLKPPEQTFYDEKGNITKTLKELHDRYIETTYHYDLQGKNIIGITQKEYMKGLHIEPATTTTEKPT